MLAWRHTFEEVSAGIVIVVWAGCDAEEVVASVAVVVVDAISDIARFLNLKHKVALSDAVHASCRKEEHIAGLRIILA